MLQMKEVRNFSKIGEALPIPPLTQIQTESYARFLQCELEPHKRKDQGLEALLREVFPIESYDGNMCLEYLSYELGKPRYTPDECRQLRLTNSSSPGSKIGSLPRRRVAIFRLSLSVQITCWPRSAKQADVTKPT